MDEEPIEHGIQMAAIQRKTVKPRPDSRRKKSFVMRSSSGQMATGRRMHPVILMQHRWRAQEL